MKTPDFFFNLRLRAHLFPPSIAPNTYGKCLTIMHTKFPARLANVYTSIYVMWSLVWVMMTKYEKLFYK
jgi:drug/metabolite transporter superfamily protein YnfA